MQLELPNSSKPVGGRWERWGLTDGQRDWQPPTYSLRAPFWPESKMMDVFPLWSGMGRRHSVGLEWLYITLKRKFPRGILFSLLRANVDHWTTALAQTRGASLPPPLPPPAAVSARCFGPQGKAEIKRWTLQGHLTSSDTKIFVSPAILIQINYCHRECPFYSRPCPASLQILANKLPASQQKFSQTSLSDGFSCCFLSLEYLFSLHEKIIIVKLIGLL